MTCQPRRSVISSRTSAGPGRPGGRRVRAELDPDAVVRVSREELTAALALDSITVDASGEQTQVDVEREMSKLAETQITYNALGQMTSAKLGILRSAINEGRR